MCGRTCLYLDKHQIQCACSYKSKEGDIFTKPEWLNEHNDGKEYSPSYNIAPTDVTPILISSNKFKNTAQTNRVLKPMMWGIIPPWHKGDYRSHNLSTNNCRLENIKSSKLYNPILKNGGRCVIVIEGFYEWQTTDKLAKVKQPYYLYAPQDDKIQIDQPQTWTNIFNEKEGWNGLRLLHLAGLYNVWQNNDTIIYSYSVITMESNSVLDWLHHRMPAILETDEQIEAWLNIDDVDPDMALSHLKPVKLLSWHQVSVAVNNSRNKSSDCNKRQQEKKNKHSQKTLAAWFSTSKKTKHNDSDEIASTSKRLKK